MGVPVDIRAVPRPVNMIVDDSGRDGLKCYAVRSRASPKYVAGGNLQIKNDKVVGYIIVYKFVLIDIVATAHTVHAKYAVIWFIDVCQICCTVYI